MRALIWIVLAAIVLVSVDSAPAHGEPPSRWPVCDVWREVPVPGDTLYPGGFGHVTDVEVMSPNDVWAISDYGYESANESHVYRWTGRRWSEVPFPQPHTGETEYWVLEAINAISPTEVWVAGSRIANDGTTRPIAGRWDGVRWRLVPAGLSHTRGWFSGVATMPGARRPIAVGAAQAAGSGGRFHTLAMTWNGSRWRRVPTPSPGRWSEYRDVVAAGTALWAVGTVRMEGSSPHVLASRRTRTGWSVRVGPRGRGEAVDGRSPGVVYAVGATPGPSGSSRGLIARWTGRRWVAAARFDRVQELNDVAVPAVGRVWAVGDSYVRRESQQHPFIVRRSSQGWRLDLAPPTEGFFSAIGGTPRNLWTFLSYPPVEFAEHWRFTAYHRC